MRIAYFDCFSGISGDMTIGALLDAGLNFKTLSSELAKLKIKNYSLKQSRILRGGISGTRFECIVDDGAHSRSFKEIMSIIEKSSLESRIKNTARLIFENIGAAEAKIHGIKKIDDIHLHELGSIDSIVDIVGTAIALTELGIDEVHASPVTTGRGSVMTVHGRLPVPAPAALELLKNIPVNIAGPGHELVTPTGAGILKTLSKGFGEPPGMTADRIGYGAGSIDNKDGLPNMLRVVVGEASADFLQDSVYIIETNIDDMNPQNFEYIFERLFKEGALDAYITNIQMKKSRPGVKLTVITERKDLNRIASVVFNETTTIGLRFYKTGRLKLKREMVNVSTSNGDVSVKISKGPGGIMTASPEYEECAKLARKARVPFKQVYDEAKAAIKR